MREDRSVSFLPAPRGLWPALLLLGLWLGPLACAKPYLVVPQSSENAVDIIDAANNALAATVPLGTSPQNVVMAPDGDEAYIGVVSTSTSGSTTTVSSALDTLDLATNSITAETPLQSGGSGIAIGAMAISPDGSTLYVINPDSGALLSLNLATGAVKTVTNYGAAAKPTAVLAGSTGRHLYVTLSETSNLSIITLATNNVSTLSIPNGFDPLALALSPDGSRLYIANSGDNTIAVLDIETGSFLNSITVTGFPESLSVSPNGATLAAALSAAGVVDLIPLNQSTPATLITVGRSPATLTYSPDGTRLYVLDSEIPDLSVIDTANASVVATLNLSSPETFAGTFGGAGDIIAQSAAFDTGQGTVLDGTLTATDDLNRTLSYAVATPPSHGQISLTASDGAFTYTPTAGFAGADHLSFTAQATSGPGAPTIPVSGPAQIRICVLPSQVSLSTIPNTAIPEASTGNQTAGLVSFTPNVSCSLSYSAVSSNTSLIPDANLQFGGLGLNRTLSLSPVSGASGTTDITVTAQAPNNVSSSQSFSVFVGEPPVITNLPSALDITVNTSSQPLNLTVTGTNPITLSATSDEPAIMPVSGIKLSGTGTTRILTLTPTPNRLGLALITITATDANGLQSSTSTDVDVIPTSNSSAVDPTTLLFLFALLFIGGWRRRGVKRSM
ncbi:MAG: beta-propeller fold lactonase family protein [Gammaproteobacteria bacterium]